jgi:hypothetical protein
MGSIIGKADAIENALAIGHIVFHWAGRTFNLYVKMRRVG